MEAAWLPWLGFGDSVWGLGVGAVEGTGPLSWGHQPNEQDGNENKAQEGLFSLTHRIQNGAQRKNLTTSRRLCRSPDKWNGAP